MPSKKTVLVTGANGFLGACLTQSLLARGYPVIGLDLASTHAPEFVTKHPSYHSLPCDITQDGLSALIPDSVETVVHLAGLSSASKSFQNPNQFLSTNVGGTVKLLMALRQKHARRFVFASSAAVYGDLSSSDILETDVAAPMNPYGLSKLVAEQYIQLLAPRLSLDYVILRLFNLYGPGQSLNQDGMIPAFIKSVLANESIVLFGDVTRVRSYVHVKDAARAIALACESQDAVGHIINICGQEGTTNIELAGMILEFSNTPHLDIRQQDSDQKYAHASHCSGAAARELLGFEPDVETRAGIRETVKSYIGR